MKVVIITPTYNEKGNVDKLIPILENDLFPRIKKHDMNILVADDKSPDGPADEVKKLMQKWKNIDISSGEKYGLGAAYTRAMTYAVDQMRADVMFEMDADFQHDPEKIPQFLQKIDEGYDMVIGNRYSDGGSIPKNWPLLRKLFSVVANLFVRTIFMKFGVHDWTGGFRALKKEVFLKEKEELTNYKGYIFQISFLHKAIRDGFKIAAIGYILEVFKFVISTRIRELLLGKFGKFFVVGGVGFIINWMVFNILLSVSNIRPEIANLAGAVLAIFSNYNFTNLWTFGERKANSITRYFLKMLQL